jgi:hypothetical protein
MQLLDPDEAIRSGLWLLLWVQWTCVRALGFDSAVLLFPVVHVLVEVGVDVIVDLLALMCVDSFLCAPSMAVPKCLAIRCSSPCACCEGVS